MNTPTFRLVPCLASNTVPPRNHIYAGDEMIRVAGLYPELINKHLVERANEVAKLLPEIKSREIMTLTERGSEIFHEWNHS